VTVNATLNPRAQLQVGRPGHGAAIGAGRDDWNAIDPNIVEDDKGDAWMAFGSFWSGIKLVKLNAEPWTRLAEPQEWHAIASANAAFTPTRGRPARSRRRSSSRRMVTTTCSSRSACAARRRRQHLPRGGRPLERGHRPVSGPLRRDMLKGGGSLVIAGDKDWKGARP
jgi:arabinan endo-1,5-alpha-L-arabinosidase